MKMILIVLGAVLLVVAGVYSSFPRIDCRVVSRP